MKTITTPTLEILRFLNEVHCTLQQISVNISVTYESRYTDSPKIEDTDASKKNNLGIQDTRVNLKIAYYVCGN